VSIVGPGSGNLTISGNNASRVFNINGPGTIAVTISGLTLTGGRTSVDNAAGRGGAIYVQDENVILADCVLTGNSAFSDGGAVSLETGGVLTIRNSALTNNRLTGAAHHGGAINLQAPATLTVEGSTIAGNTSTGDGGGMKFSGGSLLLEGDTISGNTAGQSGGGVMLAGGAATDVLTIRNVTLSGNTATAGRGGGLALSVVPGSLQVRNSTVTNNAAALAGGGSPRVQSSGPASLVSSIVAG